MSQNEDVNLAVRKKKEKNRNDLGMNHGLILSDISVCLDF